MVLSHSSSSPLPSSPPSPTAISYHTLPLPPQGRESPYQACERYTLATHAILEQFPDAVLLQECEPAFLVPELGLNPKAALLLEEYVAYCCFGADGLPPEQRQAPGCAVLLKKTGALVRVPEVDVAFVDGREEFGGKHYCSIAILCTAVGGGQLWVGGLHQCYEAPQSQLPARAGPRPKRGRQLQAIRGAMREKWPCRNIVFGGDFNATCRPRKDRQFIPMFCIEDCTWLGREMRRVAIYEEDSWYSWKRHDDDQAPTGLNPGWQLPVALDHVYLSSNMEALEAGTGGPPRNPYDADTEVPRWDANAVQAPSDHVWVWVHVRYRRGGGEDPLPPSRFEPQEYGVMCFGDRCRQGRHWNGFGCQWDPQRGWLASPDSAEGPAWHEPEAHGVADPSYPEAGGVQPDCPEASGAEPAYAEASEETAPLVRTIRRPAKERVNEVPQGGMIRMLASKFRMQEGEVTGIVGSSNSGNSWELANGKTVLKDQEGKAWVFI